MHESSRKRLRKIDPNIQVVFYRHGIAFANEIDHVDVPQSNPPKLVYLESLCKDGHYSHRFDLKGSESVILLN